MVLTILPRLSVKISFDKFAKSPVMIISLVAGLGNIVKSKVLISELAKASSTLN